MNETIFEVLGARVTTWKLIGYSGVLLFSGRWFIQLWASRRAGRPVVPRLFWYMSMVGSLMCLAYFVFGKNDSVGILAYLFPCGVSAYNLYLDVVHARRGRAALPSA
ncbi:MAG: lipid-A-disaccharide synthase N-terminal domain-containing protein [Verrucomicrobia bacterium]|nr:lipid-A-disaccharide synthase N-terminal domain-containing protein [Verrucomicrobiota bacterium]